MAREGDDVDVEGSGRRGGFALVVVDGLER